MVTRNYECFQCVSECKVNVSTMQSMLPPTGCVFPEEISESTFAVWERAADTIVPDTQPLTHAAENGEAPLPAGA